MSCRRRLHVRWMHFLLKIPVRSQANASRGPCCPAVPQPLLRDAGSCRHTTEELAAIVTEPCRNSRAGNSCARQAGMPTHRQGAKAHGASPPRCACSVHLVHPLRGQESTTVRVASARRRALLHRRCFSAVRPPGRAPSAVPVPGQSRCFRPAALPRPG